MSWAREILLEHGLFCPRGVKMSSGVYPLREFTQSSDTLKTIHIRLCESSQETLGAWTLLGKVWKFASVMGLMDFDGFWWIFLAVGRITSQAAVTLNISVWKLKYTESKVKGLSLFPSCQYKPNKQLYPGSSRMCQGHPDALACLWGWMKALLCTTFTIY